MILSKVITVFLGISLLFIHRSSKHRSSKSKTELQIDTRTLITVVHTYGRSIYTYLLLPLSISSLIYLSYLHAFFSCMTCMNETMNLLLFHVHMYTCTHVHTYTHTHVHTYCRSRPSFSSTPLYGDRLMAHVAHKSYYISS